MTDADQFEAFVRRYQDMVFATAVRLLGRSADAEDVAQTVFLKAFQHFDQIGPSPAAAGWLKTVTRHACLNHLSRHRMRWMLFSELERNERPDGSDTPGNLERALVSTSRPDLELEATDERQRLELALRQLPDNQRVPLVLFHFENMSYQEIAQTLSVSLGKVKTDIHRGRERLRQELARP